MKRLEMTSVLCYIVILTAVGCSSSESSNSTEQLPSGDTTEVSVQEFDGEETQQVSETSDDAQSTAEVGSGDNPWAGYGQNDILLSREEWINGTSSQKLFTCILYISDFKARGFLYEDFANTLIPPDGVNVATPHAKAMVKIIENFASNNNWPEDTPTMSHALYAGVEIKIIDPSKLSVN